MDDFRKAVLQLISNNDTQALVHCTDLATANEIRYNKENGDIKMIKFPQHSGSIDFLCVTLTEEQKKVLIPRVLDLIASDNEAKAISVECMENIASGVFTLISDDPTTTVARREDVRASLKHNWFTLDHQTNSITVKWHEIRDGRARDTYVDLDCERSKDVRKVLLALLRVAGFGDCREQPPSAIDDSPARLRWPTEPC